MQRFVSDYGAKLGASVAALLLLLGGYAGWSAHNPDRDWASDNQTDKLLVAAMNKGQSAVIKGTSARSNVTTDTFPLTGFSAAYKAIGDACKKP